MSETQFYVSVAVVPTVTIIIVLIGVLLNNTNMNARFDDLRSDMNARSDDLRSEMHSSSTGMRETLRAEMAKNHSEMLLKFTELDARLSHLEVPSTG